MLDKQAENQPKSSDHLLAEVAEFWTFDPELRANISEHRVTDTGETIETTSLEAIYLRNRILDTIQASTDHTEADLTRKVLGEVHRIREKSIPRTLTIRFLIKLATEKTCASPKPTAVFENLSDGEAEEKSRAKRAYADKNFTEAAKILENMLLKDQRLYRNSGILGLLNCCYFRLGNNEKTLALTKMLIELNPEESTECLKIGAISAKNLERWEDCLSLSELALKKDPEGITFLNMACVAAQKLKLWEKALIHGKKSSEIDPHSTPWSSLLLAAFNLGYYIEAQKAANALLTKNHTHTMAKAFLNKIREKRSRMKK